MAEKTATENIRLLDLPLDEEVRKNLENSKELTVMTIGCYSVGKTTLLDAMFEVEEEQLEGNPRPFRQRSIKVNDEVIKLNIYDAPGLQDGQRQDFRYLKQIKEKCPKIDLVIYCTVMTEPTRPSEKITIAKFNAFFGESLWKNAVVALTFANNVEPPNAEQDENKYFEVKLTTKKQILGQCFKELKIDGFDLIPVIPVGSPKCLKLPLVENWKVEFFNASLGPCTTEGRGALLKMAWRSNNFIRHIVIPAMTESTGVKTITADAAEDISMGAGPIKNILKWTTECAFKLIARAVNAIFTPAVHFRTTSRNPLSVEGNTT